MAGGEDLAIHAGLKVCNCPQKRVTGAPPIDTSLVFMAGGEDLATRAGLKVSRRQKRIPGAPLMDISP